jgi:hypothetical protein
MNYCIVIIFVIDQRTHRKGSNDANVYQMNRNEPPEGTPENIKTKQKYRENLKLEFV